MVLDLIIVLVYFSLIMTVALSGRNKEENKSSEEFFLSSRSLRWPSIAISTVATNVNGYQFLGMMGSAYLFGLAQANLEINAVLGLWMAAFIFVPLYLKSRVITITQFIKEKLGASVALAYTSANIILFSTLGLGGALFWGAYAADLVFGEMLSLLHPDPFTRVSILIIFLGLFSAIYTYFGGLTAVVRTDVIQFVILFLGGTVVLFTAVHHLGGWGELYKQKPELMHLHLPADHPKLPWIGIFGMILLNINYWGANQTVLQRSLAARSLKDAQMGLMVGGILKYLMTFLIIVPGIALAGILIQNPLSDPDQSFPFLVSNYLPVGLRGLILCALFASLMSTVDSFFNSLSTLWSIDIYKTYIKPSASEAQLIRAGRQTILVTLLTGIGMGLFLMYVKFNNPEQAFTHALNEFNYYIKSGVAALICMAVFLIRPYRPLALFAFLGTVGMHLLFIQFFPGMNYFVRSGLVILLAFLMVALPAIFQFGLPKRTSLYQSAGPGMTRFGLIMLVSLVLIHWIFS